MLRFNFWVRKSFLQRGTHPITVPRSQVIYREMRESNLHQGPLTVIYPHGEKLQAHMYGGATKQRGNYYQIRHFPCSGKFPSYLKASQRLLIILLSIQEKPHAILEFQE